jgi:hypothetical protein
MLTRWLLDHGIPEAAAHLAELPHARVVARCPCGCVSVDFAIAGREAPLTAGLQVLADYEWRDAEGRQAGIFVFARAGQLAGLEVYTLHPDASIDVLPAPEALVLLGSTPAA